MSLASGQVGTILEHVVSALSFSSLYALFGLGIALIFGVMRLMNFAHAAFIMAAAYAVVVLSGLPLIAVVVGSLLVAVALSLLCERLAFRPLRNADPSTLLITSFALTYVLQSLATLIFGSVPKGVNFPGGLNGTVEVAGASISELSLLTIAVTAVLLVGLLLFLHLTSTGLQMRAAAENFAMARLLGIRANVVIGMAFAMSGLLAAAAAMLLVAQTGSASPVIGITPVLIAFVATVIGGMGSLVGAVLGALAIGMVTVLFQVMLPVELGPYRDAFVFMAVFIMLVARPQGLIVTRAATTRV